MKKYFLNLFVNNSEDLHKIEFTELDIQESKNSCYWSMSEKDLIKYIAPKLLNPSIEITQLHAILSFIVKRGKLNDNNLDYKSYNCFIGFIEPRVIQLVEAIITNDNDKSMDIAYQTIAVVL